MPLFRAAGVNSTDAPIYHFEGAEILVISKTKGVLVFKVVAHAPLPTVGYFDPSVSNSGSLHIGQLDLHTHSLAWQLAKGECSKRVATPWIAQSISCFAIEKFYDASFRSHCAEQPLALTVKAAFTCFVKGVFVLSLQFTADDDRGEIFAEVPA